MENTNLSVLGGSVTAMPISRSSDGVIECTNLRQLPDGGLICASDPANITKKIIHPLTIFQIFNGKKLLILADSTTVYVTNPDEFKFLTTIAELQSDVVAAIQDSDKSVTIFTAENEPCRLCYNSTTDTWDNPDDQTEIPPVVIHADDHADLSTTVDEFTLKGSYPHCSENITAADKEVVTNLLSSAVEAISETASNAGRYLHPHLFAYKLLDSRGRLIYRSVPVWVGPEEGGLGLCDMIQAKVSRLSDGVCAVGNITVSATAFKAVIDVPRQLTGPHARDVALLEILSSTAITPYRPTLSAGCRLRAVDQSSGMFEAYIPGVANGMTPATERHQHAVKQVLELFWSTAEVIDRVAYPFAGGFDKAEGTRYTIAARTFSPIVEYSHLSKILAATIPVMYTDSDAALIEASRPPHSFTADTVLQAADMTAYTGISLLRGCPPDAAILAGASAAKQSDPAASYVAVTFADDSDDTAVSADTAADTIPTAIGPVTVYPDPDAAAITVATRTADGATSSLTLPLKRSQSGRFAYHIDADLKPIALTADPSAWAIPTDQRRPRPRPGVVAVARSSDPLRLLAATTASTAAIHRIVPSVRSSSAWDFARQHLLLFADDGICSLSVDATRSSMSVNKLYPVGIARGDAVATTPAAHYATLTDGSLVRLTGSRIDPVDSAATAVSMAWCAPHNELWLTLADGSTRVICTDNGTTYDRTFSGIRSYCSVGGYTYALTDEGLYDLSQEQTDTSVPISWKVRRPVAYRRAARRLAVDLQSPNADMKVSLRADDGAGAECSLPITTLHLRGAVNAPVQARVAAPRRRWLTLGVSGTVAPETTIYHYRIDT